MERTKLKIKRLAKKIINDRIDVMEGCREIAKLSSYLDNYDTDKNILTIRGISSESDRFVEGKVRESCSPEHLAELDLEKKGLLSLIDKIATK